ncbi:MAG TPA: sugar phosphate isomerase/epimerase family protein [Verrucomicrobiota bacterium]|nr:sugar phosphate isomerase/epimerase family protein [Verrucomicrobiota bacterium]
MKLGFASAILPELTLEQVFECAASIGYKCVEVMCWPVGKAERKYAGVTHIDVATITKQKAAEINQLCKKYNVQISALGYYPNPLDPDPVVSQVSIDHIKKVIIAARMLGLNNVNTFIGRDWTKTVEDNWDRFLKVWKPMVAFAAEQKINIGIENCPMLFTNDEWPGGKNLAHSPVIWRRMFNDIPDKNFGLNYDPSHLVWQQMDWIKPVREFKDRIFHLHAKDVLLNRTALKDCGILATPLKYHLPRIPGFGEIDWHKFIGVLREVDYCGPVCVEVEDDTFGKTLDGRKLALKVAYNVLSPLIPE